MSLPDYPNQDKLEKITIYKDLYPVLIFITLFFSVTDFFILKSELVLHIFNLCKFVLLVSLHQFFKVDSKNKKEEEQIRIFIYFCFVLPLSIFFAFRNYELGITSDEFLFKKFEYYIFQFSILISVAVIILRFEFETSIYLNTSTFIIYSILIFFFKNSFYGNLRTEILIYYFITLLFFSSLGVGINFYLRKYFINQNLLIDKANFFKNYSEDLLKTQLPKTYYFQNICLLYFDITGIANYFRSKESLATLDSYLKLFFSETDKFREQNKIELHEDSGKYWFLALEHPASTNPEYADPIADLSIFLQTSFKKLCIENNLQFELRMGISSGKYIDYKTNSQKLEIFYLNNAFNEAAEMEKFGINGEIQVTEETHKLLKHRFSFIKRGKVYLKSENEEPKEIYLLHSRV